MRCLKDDERGAILIYFTLALLPLLVVGGAAMDLGHVFLVKQRLTNAVDSASLALGARRNLSSDEATALVEAFISTRYSGTPKSLAVSDTATQVSVTVTVQVPMTFMQVLNTQSVDVTVTATAVRPQGKLEVALVLDQTGSMAGDRITNLKLAAKDLIDIVIWDNQTDDYYSKVAIVPYAAGVNVGAYAPSVRGSILTGSGICLLPGCEFFQFLNPSGLVKVYGFSTCVSERTGPKAYTEDPPNIALVGTNYPPLLSANNPCPTNTIVPLTNDKALLKAQINLLQANGSTAGHIGVAWGWYLLSSRWGDLWPDSRPAAFADPPLLDARGLPLLRKIVILMTDGDFNTAYCNGVISQDSTPGSSGSLSDHINCNAPNGTSSFQAQSLCTNMKAAGILVYTIGFGVTDPSPANTLMRDCATDRDHAYLASTGDELRQAFREIATRIASLRLTH